MLWLILRVIERVSQTALSEMSRVAQPIPQPEDPRTAEAASGLFQQTLEFNPEEEDIPVWAQGLTTEEYEQMVREGFDPVTGRPLR